MPANIKIDGKADEWDDKFEAYNAATNLYYTVANDDKRLYFVFLRDNKSNGSSSVQGNLSVRSGALINYLINGGIRINIQKSVVKNDKGASGVIFPYFKAGAGLRFNFKDVDIIDKQADSVMRASNKKLNAGAKWIYTTGIPGVDTELPVFNENGIEAANAFDIKKNYVCELAIDLNHLGLSVNDASKFSYHIILNGGPRKYSFVNQLLLNAPKVGKNADGSPMTESEVDKVYESFRNAPDPNAATTDFWGEYILAK